MLNRLRTSSAVVCPCRVAVRPQILSLHFRSHCEPHEHSLAHQESPDLCSWTASCPPLADPLLLCLPPYATRP